MHGRFHDDLAVIAAISARATFRQTAPDNLQSGGVRVMPTVYKDTALYAALENGVFSTRY